MTGKSHAFVAPLFEGPLDVVGDIHGEIDALQTLLDMLGHDLRHDRHPEGRRLVFVGDLVDRGPDSPAVVDLVREYRDRGLAQCVLGNHELNLLNNSKKDGNAWFLDSSRKEQQPGGEFAHSRPVPPELSSDLREFFASLPLALRRPDLRVVHAAWSDAALAALAPFDGASTAEVFKHFEDLIKLEGTTSGLEARAKQEEQDWHAAWKDRNADIPFLPATAAWNTQRQMANPIRILTSGVERPAKQPFFSSGEWRMCDRVRWWEDYHDAASVVIGHYWRQRRPVVASTHASSKPDLFADTSPQDWVGPRQNVYCVDFSVGARYQERHRQMTQFDTTLAALRLPERQLVLEQEDTAD
jgi:Calcineurin-like phosphoesterase